MLTNKEHLPGEDNEGRLPFTPRRGGWSLDPKAPEGFKCIAVRIAREADGTTHRLYKYVMTAKAVAELRRRADEAEAAIHRTDLTSEIVATRAEIGRLQQHLASLEETHATFVSPGREAPASTI